MIGAPSWRTGPSPFMERILTQSNTYDFHFNLAMTLHGLQRRQARLWALLSSLVV